MLIARLADAARAALSRTRVMSRSLVLRLMVSFVAMALLACATLLATALHDRIAADSQAVERDVRGKFDEVMDAMNGELDVVRAAAVALAATPPLRAAILSGDTGKIAEILDPILSDVRRPSGIRSLTALKAPGIAAYRAHAPSSSGDDVSAQRLTVAETFRNGAISVGLEPARDRAADLAAQAERLRADVRAFLATVRSA
jgi:methyl-accepting chemotaxis protein